MEERVAKLNKLRAKLDLAAQENRQALFAEHRRNQTDVKAEQRAERRRQAAEASLAEFEAKERGEDVQRQKNWTYTMDDVARWDEKLRKKAERVNTGFTDWNQLALKKYEKQIQALQPNLQQYEEQKQKQPDYRDANSLEFLSQDAPGEEAVDKLVKDVQHQIEVRSKHSKRRPFNEDEDVTYINDRNMRFNKKIARAYDRYTKDIRDSFERGTAL